MTAVPTAPTSSNVSASSKKLICLSITFMPNFSVATCLSDLLVMDCRMESDLGVCYSLWFLMATKLLVENSSMNLFSFASNYRLMG